MPGNKATGHEARRADAEARWFAELVGSGRLTLDDARDAITVPVDVQSVWAEASASDPELAAMLSEAANFRQLVGERFEKMLTEPAAPRKEVKIIQRSGKRAARPPVFAITAAQEPRSLAPSLPGPESSLSILLPSGGAESGQSDSLPCSAFPSDDRAADSPLYT